MIVHVSAEHIRRGVPGSRCNCPIALAMIAAGIEAPDVNPISISGFYGRSRFRVPTPASLRELMATTDCGGAPDPVAFNLPFEAWPTCMA